MQIEYTKQAPKHISKLDTPAKDELQALNETSSDNELISHDDIDWD